MRSVRILLAIAIALVVVAGPASGAPANSGDYVSGSGYRLGPEGDRRVQFNVYAESDASVTWGSYWFNHLIGDLTFSGQVRCLDVDGNLAAVGGVITRTTTQGSASLLGAKFLVFLIDNSDQDPGNPDVVSQTYILPADAGLVTVPSNFPATCPDVGTAHDAFLVEGDIAIGNVAN